MTALSATAVAERVRELPALPAALAQLLSALEDPAPDIERLTRLMALDQALSVKALRLANSSFYGLPRQVHSIGDAVQLLGLRSIRNIVLAAGLVSALTPHHAGPLDLTGFWRHATATALCAEALALRLELDVGAAFTLGLLHDIGRLVLASGFPAPYQQVLSYQAQQDCPALQAERAVLGTDHAHVGALMAERWNFAPQLIDAIALHHQPPEQGPALAVDLVHLADNIAHALDLAGLTHEMVPPLALHSWLRLQPSETPLLAVFADVEQRHAALCQTLLS